MPSRELEPPAEGRRIESRGGKLAVPDHPILPFIEGDGIGPDVMRAARRAVSAAVQTAYGGKRDVAWFETFAGEKAKTLFGELLPAATLRAIRDHAVALKGPLTTPIGGGFRSLNVTLRQTLDLYANVRPVYWLPGVPSPMRHPERMNIIIFREATEDVYAGIEWAKGSAEARRLIEVLRRDFGVNLREDSGVGIKPISEFGTKRLVRKAMRYAVEHGRRSVTLVHKGNIMKYTEGAFMQWGYEVAREEFGTATMTQQDVLEKHGGKPPAGKVLVRDVVADNMFQQLLTRTDEYDVLATPNLNGDYLSDAAGAQVGGLGVVPGGNIGDDVALFEPVHGSAPKYAGQDKANPTAEILASVMLLEHIGWTEAATLLREAVKRAVGEKKVTYDLARQMDGAKELGTAAFTDEVIANLFPPGTAKP